MELAAHTLHALAWRLPGVQYLRESFRPGCVLSCWATHKALLGCHTDVLMHGVRGNCSLCSGPGALLFALAVLTICLLRPAGCAAALARQVPALQRAQEANQGVERQVRSQKLGYQHKLLAAATPVAAVREPNWRA